MKMKVYRTVVRPALVNGAGTLALKKAQEKKVEVAEMRMLRWIMCGVMQLDEIRNERILTETTKVGGNCKESAGKDVEVVWACDEMIGAPRRKEGD